MSNFRNDLWLDGVRARLDTLGLYMDARSHKYTVKVAEEMISNGNWDELDYLLDAYIDGWETKRELELDYARGK